MSLHPPPIGRKAFRHLLVRKGVMISLESAVSKHAAVVYKKHKAFEAEVDKVHAEHMERFPDVRKRRKYI